MYDMRRIKDIMYISRVHVNHMMESCHPHAVAFRSDTFVPAQHDGIYLVASVKYEMIWVMKNNVLLAVYFTCLTVYYDEYILSYPIGFIYLSILFRIASLVLDNGMIFPYPMKLS